MTTKVVINYYWKEITEDGLVKEPRPVGPYYAEESLNNHGRGYASKEEALADFCQFRENHKWGATRPLFLFEEYDVAVED